MIIIAVLIPPVFRVVELWSNQRRGPILVTVLHFLGGAGSRGKQNT